MNSSSPFSGCPQTRFIIDLAVATQWCQELQGLDRRLSLSPPQKRSRLFRHVDALNKKLDSFERRWNVSPECYAS